MKQVDIDLDVYRVIENGRISFDESPNAILRRLLAIDARQPRPDGGMPARPRASRSSGAYSTMLGNSPIEANSLKELLRRVILKGAQLKPDLVTALAAEPTGRGRHIVASTPEALYPKTPQLRDYAERLDADWWYDTNVGRNQVQAYFRVIATLLDLPHIPAISKRMEKSTMTLEDLGLAS